MSGLNLPERVRVGSYFLETMTTGMYEDPFHCIREYVQNSFDAINDAVDMDVLSTGAGRVVVSITGKDDRIRLTVRDDGSGIPQAEVVERLISLGSSTKRPARHAGFRGIGRLAGIAYCTTLRFTTTALGEETASTVEFDCAKLRGFMQPGAKPREVSDVIKESTKLLTAPARSQEHYTLVEMVNLSGEGLEFAKPERLTDYLNQYAPVDYATAFPFAQEVRDKAAGFGLKIPIIDVELKVQSERVAILKPYKKAYPTEADNDEKRSTLTRINWVHSKERGWCGWYGESNFPGAIRDKTVAGIRFRMKNIQIGDEAIIEDIMAELTDRGSDRRLARWAVGEVFVTNPQVVPNARRDGFEDNDAWEAIRQDLKQVAGTIVKEIRNTSRNRSRLKSVDKKLKENQEKVAGITGPTAAASVRAIDEDLQAQLSKIEKAVKAGADPKLSASLVTRIKEVREQLRAVPLAQAPVPASMVPRAEAMEAVRTVLTAHLAAKQATKIADEIGEALASLS